MDEETREALLAIKVRLDTLMEHFKIKPNMDYEVTDVSAMLAQWSKASSLAPGTKKEREGTIREFLATSNNLFSKNNVMLYLNGSKSEIEYNKRLKALRPFLRDWLQTGNWIDDFKFKVISHKTHDRELPSNSDLLRLAHSFKTRQGLQIFLLLFTSGLRINEILQLDGNNLDVLSRTIDARELHTGDTKKAWYSFITLEASNFFVDFSGFSVNYPAFYSEWQAAITAAGLPDLLIKDLRLLFAEKAESVGIEDKYINAFQGRISGTIRTKHYTDYNPRKLLTIYDKLEPLLTLGL